MFNPLHSLVKYTYVTFIFSFTPDSGRYIGEISKISSYFVQNYTFQLAIYGHNQNFNFCPAINQIYCW